MQVSGLVSGLDTKTIVSQLMAAERKAGDGLTTAKTQSNALVTTLQRLNNLVSDMSKAAKALIPDTIFNTSAWSAVTTTSSAPGLASASAISNSTAATAGSYTFTVQQVARAGSSISAQGYASSGAVVSATDLTFSVVKGKDATTGTATAVTITGGSTLAQAAKAITDSAAGVSASVVTKADGQSYLQLVSKTTGEASNVFITDGAGGDTAAFGASAAVSAGQDTQITVGDGPGAYSVSSATTKVDGFIPGVSVTAIKADPLTPVSVSVTPDQSGLADKVKAMVDAANAVNSQISINSKWDPTAKTGGPYLGDSTTRDLTNKVQNVFVGAAGALPSLAGIAIDKTGSITFDKAAFQAAYDKDPKAVESNVTAIAKKLDDVGKAATNATDGSLTLRIQGEQALVKDYTTQIAKFEDRMTLRQQTLERQFSALETMLNKLQSQGNWLAGQLKSLPSPSSK